MAIEKKVDIIVNSESEVQSVLSILKSKPTPSTAAKARVTNLKTIKVKEDIFSGGNR